MAANKQKKSNSLTKQTENHKKSDRVLPQVHHSALGIKVSEKEEETFLWSVIY